MAWGRGGNLGMTMTMGMGMGMDVISPLLAPVVEQGEGVMSRKERRRGRKRAEVEDLGIGIGVGGVEMPGLRI
jgi:hypothetical protein